MFEIMHNNTFDLKLLEDTLTDIKESAFDTLYGIQKSMVDIYRADLSPVNYIIETDREYTYSVNYDFIGSNRKIFRASKFYNTTITLNDIITNPKIFSHVPILFINGEMYTNYTISVDEDKLLLHFNVHDTANSFFVDNFYNILYNKNDIEWYNESTQYYIGDMVKYINNNGTVRVLESIADNVSGRFNDEYWVNANSNTKMTLLIIPTHTAYYTYYNKTGSTNNKSPHMFNLYSLEAFAQSGGMPLDNTKDYYKNTLARTESGLAFISGTNSYKYQLLDGDISAGANSTQKFVPTEGSQQISTLIKNIKTESKPAKFGIIYLNDHLKTIRLGKDVKYFNIELQDYPVPIENFIIFKISDTGEVYYDHDAKLTLYYPNVYELTRTGNEQYDVMIYVMYSNSTPTIDFGCQNELQIYHRFTENIVSKYADGTIPSEIKDYNNFDIVYDIPNYTNTVDTHNGSTLKYKIDKFKYLASRNGEFYRWYLQKHLTDTNRSNIYVKNIDLTTRIRSGNSLEISDPSIQKSFNENRYMFILSRNYDENATLVLFLDNLLYYPDEIYNVGTRAYVYIPVDMVHPSSILRLETMVATKFSETFEYVYQEYVHISIPANVPISANDIFISNSTVDGDVYLPDDQYELYSKDVNGEYKLINQESFYNYKDIYVKILNRALYGSIMTLHAHRLCFSHKRTHNQDFIINFAINRSTNNIRLFKNGKLIPDNAIKIHFNDNIHGPHTIRTTMTSEADDEFVLVYSTDKYKKIVELKTLPIDANGNNSIIDLKNYTAKPIDFRWHDIYLNGVRLTENEVDIVSPYVFMLKNTSYARHLVIYERNFDTDILGPVSIDDVTVFQEKYIPGEFISDDIPDISDDIVIDYAGFINDCMKNITLINPDLQQITEEMQDLYFDVLNSDGNMYINPDTGNMMNDDVIINPDKPHTDDNDGVIADV